MGNKLYVGNLPYSVTDDSLKEIFAAAGNVQSAKVITERETGRSKGFGFVEMSTDEEATKAINELNGKDIDGRKLSVAEARPQKPRENRFGGGGGGGRDRGDRGGRGRRF